MAEQEEKNISNFIENSLKSIKKLYKREYINLNLDLENENFTNNFEEIIKNPSSNYFNETNLFSEIPNLKLQKDELEKEITGDPEAEKDSFEEMGLENYKAKLEREIYSDLKKDENGNPILSVEIKEILNKSLLDRLDIDKIGLEAYRKKLEKQIYGDEESQDEIEKMGFEMYSVILKTEIYGDVENEKELVENEEDIKILKKWFKGVLNRNKVNNELERDIIEEFGLKKYYEILNNEKNELRKEYKIAKDLSTLIKRSTYDKGWYYGFMVFTIAFLVLSSCFAYCYGTQIIVEIKGMKERTSSDYFGFFLMKMPFSLIIIAFISGAFIFINKLLFIIERINNQLRNFSKISVIASQMDNTYIDLIKNGNFSNGNEAEQNAHKEAEQKDLFYKLITNYLVSLSKNEADLADSKKEPLLKQVKQIAGIVKEFNSFNKDK